MVSLDALTEQGLGFAVYAYTPGGGVTLELFNKGDLIHTITAPTLADCLASLEPRVPGTEVPAEPPAVTRPPSFFD